MAAPRPGRVTLLLAAIGALAAVLVLLRVSEWGPEAGPDATLYVSAARNLLAGEGFTGYRGTPYGDAAPLFPLALALAGLSGPDPLDAAGLINAAAFGLTAFAAAAWVRCRARSAFLAVWAGLACALSPPLAEVASAAMTEPLFVLFVTLSLFALDRYREGGGRSLLLAAAACAALACATRYLGLALVAAALPLLAATGRRGLRLPRRGIEDAALFAAVALAPLGAWMLRNLLAVGSPTGRFYHGGWDALAVLDRTTGEFARWTLGEGGYARLRAIAEALPGGAPPPDGGISIPLVALQAAPPLALASVAAAAAAFARRRGGVWPGGGLAVPLAFASVYGPATLFMAWRLGFGLEARYLAPLYPPLLVAAAIALGGLLRRASERGPLVRLPRGLGGTGASAPALALAAALALWLPQQAAASLDDVRRWRAEGMGWTAREWTESGLVRWLRTHPLEGYVVTNHPGALYLAADLRTTLPEPDLLPDDASAWGPRAWVVWVHGRRPEAGGAADVAATPGLELVAILDRGVVFRVADAPGAGFSLAEALLEGARPLARSGFGLWLDEDRRRLIYVRDGCAEADAAAPFRLDVYPADAADLPRGRRAWGFDAIAFGLQRHGFVEGERCVAYRALPDYGIAAIRTGQWPRRGGSADGGGELWSVRVPLGAAAPAAATLDLEALRGRAAPLASGAPFEVYRDGGRLVYVREGCDAPDAAAPFFLHVVPLDPADLPEERREPGFDNLDFAFGEAGALEDGRCVAVRELPAYRVASVRTGQWVRGEGQLWAVEAAFGER